MKNRVHCSWSPFLSDSKSHVCLPDMMLSDPWVWLGLHHLQNKQRRTNHFLFNYTYGKGFIWKWRHFCEFLFTFWINKCIFHKSYGIKSFIDPTEILRVSKLISVFNLTGDSTDTCGLKGAGRIDVRQEAIKAISDFLSSFPLIISLSPFLQTLFSVLLVLVFSLSSFAQQREPNSQEGRVTVHHTHTHIHKIQHHVHAHTHTHTVPTP